MMPLVFKSAVPGITKPVSLYVNPWHIGAWYEAGGHAVIVIHGLAYNLEDTFEDVNREIREADQPE